MTSVNNRARQAGRALFVAAALGVLAAAAPLLADSINYTPASPSVEQRVSFQYVRAIGGVTNSIRWTFGDGTAYLSAPGVLTASHQYISAGVFPVQAQIQTAGSVSPIIRTNINIVERRSVTFTPPNPVLGQPVTFSAVRFLSTSLLWDFGDGSMTNGGLRQVHVYRRAGAYRVTAKDWSGKSAVAIGVLVTVGAAPPSTAIVYSPAELRANETVEFRAIDFTSTTLIRWDFGDGMTENDTSPPVIAHAFRNPGTYLVRAFDGGSGTPTAQVAVRVWPERVITFTPPDPREGEEITFRAFNFTSPSLRWDFGDGSVLDPAGTQVTHIYATPGPWTVRAFDRVGSAEVSKDLSLTIFPAQGPRARFSVSFIQIRFEDGKPYKVVPREFGALTAFAEIKFEGTGILQAQWLVDGMPFKTVFTTLSFAGSTIIDSGRVPGLPSLIPGLHEVTLSLLQPRAEFTIPVIRYFVTSDGALVAPVDIVLAGAGTIDGAALGGDEATVEAPVGAHFLIKGHVRNESPGAVPFALLRVFLDDAVVDQKLVRDLAAGEERAFASSVFNATPSRKRLVIALYDISRRPASILSMKELAVVPPK